MTLGNDNGTDGQTDGQTDRRTDRVRRNMRPPPREEGRIITCPGLHPTVRRSRDLLIASPASFTTRPPSLTEFGTHRELFTPPLGVLHPPIDVNTHTQTVLPPIGCVYCSSGVFVHSVGFYALVSWAITTYSRCWCV